MEKRLNKTIEEYTTKFKDNIRIKLQSIQFNEHSKINELLEFIYDYERLQLKKEDIVKRKRIKNSIPILNRCSAKRCNNEQCTRRRKDDSIFCGTHIKGTPHGLIETSVKNGNDIQKIELSVEEINGIVYYIDSFSNVYSTEDVLQDKQNPRIIAKYKLENDHKYTIYDFV
jgi:hypothetical protein